MFRRALGVLVVAAAGVSGITGQSREPDPLLAWMDHIGQEQLQRRETDLARIRSVADAEARKRVVREKILSLLGGLPDDEGPLKSRITGLIESNGYVIEKVIYQSLPGFYVTANLYRPERDGRYPGILLQAGHTQEGKPEGQRLAVNLALKGFVVLAFDPIGQGEREQTYDSRVDTALAGWSVPEHIQAGAQSLLVGESAARYFIWDAKRSLDYLASRPEVDSSRLGAVGCSGGGALTTFIGALDPRVKVVAPACYINSYRVLFAGPDPDTEMSLPHFLASGLDMGDLVELSAPNPWLILATEGDYFTPAGARMVYEEARRWFALYGAEEKVRLFVGGGPHGTPLETREEIYKWMITWLKDGRGDWHEQSVANHTNHELLVTRSGHVDEEPGSRKLYQLILERYRLKRKPGTILELVSELQRLGIVSAEPPPKITSVADTGNTDWSSERIRFESQPGVELRGKLYVPRAAGRKPAVLVVADKTSNYWIPPTSAQAAKLTRAGRVVLELEVRNSPGEGERPYVGNWITNSRANQIGLVLPALRALDIVRGIDILAARDDVDPGSIRAIARGVKGVWLLLAAAADPRIGKVWLDRTPGSLRAALEHPMNTDLFDAVIPGFVLRWDLADLVTAMGQRSVLWTDPTNWMNRPAALEGPYRYRYILGDTTDLLEKQDDDFLQELMR
jgi:cephalosporin-C deacetylase-like acetyl esterase